MFRNLSERVVRNARKSEDCASMVSCWMVARSMRGCVLKKEAAWSPAFLMALALRYLLEIWMMSANEVISASEGYRKRRSFSGSVSGCGGPYNDWIQSLIGGSMDGATCMSDRGATSVVTENNVVVSRESVGVYVVLYLPEGSRVDRAMPGR